MREGTALVIFLAMNAALYVAILVFWARSDRRQREESKKSDDRWARDEERFERRLKLEELRQQLDREWTDLQKKANEAKP